MLHIWMVILLFFYILCCFTLCYLLSYFVIIYFIYQLLFLLMYFYCCFYCIISYISINIMFNIVIFMFDMTIIFKHISWFLVFPFFVQKWVEKSYKKWVSSFASPGTVFFCAFYLLKRKLLYFIYIYICLFFVVVGLLKWNNVC